MSMNLYPSLNIDYLNSLLIIDEPEETSSTETSSTTICDLPLFLRQKIKNMVPDLHLQDHKKKFQHALEAIPDVAKVLWTYSSVGGPFMPIKIQCFYDEVDDDDAVTEADNFLLEVQTDLEYSNINGMITQSTNYHDALINY